MKRIITFILLSFALTAQAHEFSTANLTLEQTAEKNHVGYISISLQDLQETLQIDPNNNGQLTWNELSTNHAKIEEYLLNNINFSSGGVDCSLTVDSDIKLTQSYGETLLKQPLTLLCENPIAVNYTGFFDTTSEHKLLANWTLLSGQSQTIFESPSDLWQVDASKVSAWETFTFYLYQGMIHIWIGLDHVLFVITLLLHFVWIRTSQKVQATEQASTPLPGLQLKPMIWLVTGFTLAHSITLTLTALDLISVSSKWAEVGIAISVAYSALNVLTHWIKRLMLMTVGFGLLHGLGFAGALNELGLSKSNQLTSILGFNLGVEIGQIVIILIAIPILWLLNKALKLKSVIVPAIAFAIFLLGLFWVWQRI